MLWAAFLVGLEIASAEITILKFVQTIYDRSPKLRIKGSGFDADEHSILLTLNAQGQPPLKLDKDFLITKDDDGIILKLLSIRRWEIAQSTLHHFSMNMHLPSIFKPKPIVTIYFIVEIIITDG